MPRLTSGSVELSGKCNNTDGKSVPIHHHSASAKLCPYIITQQWQTHTWYGTVVANWVQPPFLTATQAACSPLLSWLAAGVNGQVCLQVLLACRPAEWFSRLWLTCILSNFTCTQRCVRISVQEQGATLLLGCACGAFLAGSSARQSSRHFASLQTVFVLNSVSLEANVLKAVHVGNTARHCK